MAGWYESIDGAGALHNIAAIPDQHITVFGDDIRVPRGMAQLIGRAVLSAADTALTDAILKSPTLRRIFNLNVGILVNAAVFGNPPESLLHPLSPIPLTADENLSLEINSDSAAAAVEYGLVWFSDGAIQPINGQFYTMRATGAAALSAGAWVNTAMTFSQDLPAGVYKIVGMRAEGTNLVAARLVFQGYSWRPGVPAVNALGDRDAKWFRMGRLGDWGEFDQTSPPTVDCLGVTDTSQVFYLDLLKVA
jgi:hypothetical protein